MSESLTEASSNWRAATRLVHSGTSRSEFGETSEAMYLTQGFVYDSAEAAEARFAGDEDGYIYSRYGNPTVTMFEQRMCALEGAEAALATASGMGAVSAALLCQLKAGDHIVAARALFGSCRWVVEKLAPQFGIESTLVDGTDLDAWKAAMQPNTKVCFLESPTNPTLELVDIAAVADLAHENGAKLVVDNVFATPILQRPLELGADIVTYSATKHIDGQGRSLGGAVLSNDAHFMEKQLTPFYRNTGPSLSPFNAWVLLKGLETMDLRVGRQCENALTIATFLEGQSAIERVLYPGLKSHPQFDLAMTQMSGRGSTVVAFEVKGGKAEAFKTINALNIIDIANNLGDAKSLITHPATTTHQRLSDAERETMGIQPNLVRLSVGIEDVQDLIDDLAQALST